MLAGYGVQAGGTKGQQTKGIGMIHISSHAFSLSLAPTNTNNSTEGIVLLWQAMGQKLVDTLDKELKEMVFYISDNVLDNIYVFIC